MKKNFNHSEMLKKYLAFASLFAAGSTAQAQIIYTDFNPDVVLDPGSVYHLDLNNDNNFEYQFKAASSGIDPDGNKRQIKLLHDHAESV
ncbi:MAG: hypothetical protein ABIQ74_00790 [Chitinophagales bacterium]